MKKLISALVLFTSISSSALSTLQPDLLLDRPNSNCYWVEPGRFLAGEYPATRDFDGTRTKLASYLDAGITFFLDLTEEYEFDYPGSLCAYEVMLQQEASKRGVSVHYRRMPIVDMSVPSKQEMDEILATVEDALKQGHKVYVHCWAGIGRTGTVIGCYLVQKGFTGKEALEQIAQWWSTVAKSKRHPKSPQTNRQRSFVRKYRLLS